jgi:hypothetical protein
MFTFSDKKHIVSETSLSGFSIERKRGHESHKFSAVSAALNESTEVSDTKKVPVFDHGIDMEFNRTKK